jgi:L-fuculose-phosphate aldolase
MQLANEQPRLQLLKATQKLGSLGLNQGTAGNLSLRLPDGLLITPSSLPCVQMGPGDLVHLDHEGRVRHAAPGRQPSSEWRLHADILRSRPDVQAVVHCHSIRATALACHGRGIPAFHYMVVQAGGAEIRCAPYATFGGQELSDRALEALRDRRACLLAHHGQVTLGGDLDQAVGLAVEVETLAHMYLEALQLGEPPLLEVAEMERVALRMQALHYGAAAPAGR